MNKKTDLNKKQIEINQYKAEVAAKNTEIIRNVIKNSKINIYKDYMKNKS
ncbi:MAG: hypothetical protein LBL00_03400 [Endomicrobium sp.]|jgi:hypothetical protein|nr:hypothetical protein [Endomicrobium sp.]